MSRKHLNAELARVKEVARQHAGPLELQVDRVTMTSGGVMLLLLRVPTSRECEDPSEIDALRNKFLEAMPNGSSPTKLLHAEISLTLSASYPGQ